LGPFKALLQFNHSSYLSLAKMLRFYEIHPSFFAIPKLSTLRRSQLRDIKNPHALPSECGKHNAELNLTTSVTVTMPRIPRERFALEKASTWLR
jgi:hypothetical protein